MQSEQLLILNLSMNRISQFINSKLSIRISLIVVLSTTILLIASLIVMFYYARKGIKEEATQTAAQTLDGIVQNIDNILLSVEQTAGNFYWNMLTHLNEPERMFTICSQVVQSNPNIAGCAIAFEPYYYKSRGKYFMAYVYRAASDSVSTTDSPFIQAETFGNRPYNEQIWYTKAMELGQPYWTDPLKGENTEDDKAIITFSLPIYNIKGDKIGIMGVDVSLSLLSQIILATKPSPNSYCTMLGRNGSYIVHPDNDKLLHHTVFTQLKPEDDPSEKEVAEAMVAGKTGYRPLRQDGTDYYVFYKPFRPNAVPGRAANSIEWSVGIIYPEEDIFGEYNRLLYYILALSIIALLLLTFLCWTYTHRQLLPLRTLTLSAQRIADGHYDEPIPDNRHEDEIGRLQDAFRHMQQSLSLHINELKYLTTTLQERGEKLHTAYDKAQEADRMKTKFLHNMTNQMLDPANNIVTIIITNYQ